MAQGRLDIESVEPRRAEQTVGRRRPFAAVVGCSAHCRRRVEGRARRHLYEGRAALVQWLAMLRADGRMMPRVIGGDAAIEAEIADFDRYLVEVRGLEAGLDPDRRDLAAHLLRVQGVERYRHDRAMRRDTAGRAVATLERAAGTVGRRARASFRRL